MGSHSTTVELTELRCVGCCFAVDGGSCNGILETLRKTEGVCSGCQSEQFRAVFTVKRISKESIAKRLAGPAAHVMFGPLVGGLVHGVVGEGSSGKSEAEFILSGVDGRLLLEKMGLPPEEAASWLLSVEKERAKANLTRHQGICKQCGEIFKMGLAGHSVEGYCSPGCRKRGFKSTAAAVSNTAAEPVVAQAIDCPHCGRAIKAKPGGRCIYCGKAVLI